MKRAVSVLFVVVSLASCHSLSAATHHITLANGKAFDLKLPDGFGISVAAQGLKRVRFMARSPDDRIFVTDMYNLTDNKRGVVYILEDFDPATRQFKKLTKYLTGLRNSNSVAFYTDESGTSWFNGRPADVFSFGKNAFLLTDDYSGVVYYVYRKS